MFLSGRLSKSRESFTESVKRLKNLLSEADAVLIGAGAGLSTSAGYTYSGKRFEDAFAEYEAKYGFHDMYSGGFYPYKTLEEHWAYWSEFIYVNRYVDIDNGTYDALFQLVKDNDYFVLTTNVDHRFQAHGFDKHKLFYTQGDYGLFQCSEPCCNVTYDNEKAIYEMRANTRDLKIPTELIPLCPKCGKPMSMNLRSDDTFVQDDGWYAANDRYNDFIRRHKGMKVLFLELGVGYNTPGIIKYPFWRMTAENKNSAYCCINYGEAVCPSEIDGRAVCIDSDIGRVLKSIV